MLLFLLGQDAVFVSDKVLSTSIKALKNELAGMQARERECVCVCEACLYERACVRRERERECTGVTVAPDTLCTWDGRYFPLALSSLDRCNNWLKSKS